MGRKPHRQVPVPLRGGISRTDEPPCLVASGSVHMGALGGGDTVSSCHTRRLCCHPHSLAGQTPDGSPCRGLCCPPGREGPLSSATGRGAGGRALGGRGGRGGCLRRWGLSLTALLLTCRGATDCWGPRPCRRRASEPALSCWARCCPLRLGSAGSCPLESLCAISGFSQSVLWALPGREGDFCSLERSFFSLFDLTPDMEKGICVQQEFTLSRVSAAISWGNSSAPPSGP